MRGLVTLVVSLIAFAAPAAPVPKALKKPVDYYPLGVGSKWEFEGTESDGTTSTWVYEVSGSESQAGGRTVTLNNTHVSRSKRSESTITFKTVLRVSERGVESVNTDGGSEYCVRILTVNLTPGETWKDTWTISRNEFSAVRTVGQPERITVPAGSFTAIPVTKTHSVEQDQQTETKWYAAGVGMVKYEREGSVLELKSFTPGK